MKEIIISPNICAFSDDNAETLNVQIELPGVDKKNIE
jgi:HSP20 family molecular chaperone IbpA